MRTFARSSPSSIGFASARAYTFAVVCLRVRRLCAACLSVARNAVFLILYLHLFAFLRPPRARTSPTSLARRGVHSRSFLYSFARFLLFLPPVVPFKRMGPLGFGVYAYSYSCDCCRRSSVVVTQKFTC